MSIPRLTYFGFRGLGEPVRLMFEDAAAPLDDVRVDFAGWQALKKEMPFGQMPRLEMDGVTLVQSQVIYRHVARKFELTGASPAEALRCEMSSEGVRDAQQRLWDHFWMPGSDKPEAAAAFEREGLPASLTLLEHWLGDRPYFAGDRLSYADFYAVTHLDEVCAYFPKALDALPALNAFRRRIWDRPRLAAYAKSGRQPKGFGFDPVRNVRLGIA